MPDRLSRFKRKPVQVYLTTTAVWDIEGYQITASDLDSLIANLEAVPVSDNDALWGTIRYRVLKGWEVVFQITSSQTEMMIDVCGIRPPEEESASEKVKSAVEKVALMRGFTGL